MVWVKHGATARVKEVQTSGDLVMIFHKTGTEPASTDPSKTGCGGYQGVAGA